MTFGRNDPCYCGSGRKYKKCCLAKDQDRRLIPAAFPTTSPATPKVPVSVLAKRDTPEPHQSRAYRRAVLESDAIFTCLPAPRAGKAIVTLRAQACPALELILRTWGRTATDLNLPAGIPKYWKRVRRPQFPSLPAANAGPLCCPGLP